MSMNSILLLGAGFSHNWDAPLSREVANSLLRKVHNDAYLQALLTKHEKNFEDALSEIQQAYVASPSSAQAENRLVKLQAAIVEMFERLNGVLERRMPSFEFSQEVRFSVSDFLARFDVIFGLNQDLLLELHYAPRVSSALNAHRWGGLQMPGINLVNDRSIKGIGDQHRQRWMPAPPPFRVDPRLQPYFKMHASSNWYTNDGGHLLVMGGNKDVIIKQSAVLSWYYDKFKAYLSLSDTRLMVIGYSFSDRHINDAIIEARRNHSLMGMFLVDPVGRNVLPNNLKDIPSLGCSTRPIATTFGRDEFEYQTLTGFFSDFGPVSSPSL